MIAKKPWVIGFLIGISFIFFSVDFLLVAQTREPLKTLADQCTETHKGDLILQGDQVLIIENETYCLEGDLFVSGNARVILRNGALYLNGQLVAEDTAQLIMQDSTLSFQLSSTHDRWMTIDNQARWIATNVLVTTNYQFAIRFRGKSQINLAHVTFNTSCQPAIYIDGDPSVTIKGSNIGNLFMWRGASTTVKDSSIGGLLLGFDVGDTQSLENLRPGFISSWSYDHLQLHLQLLSTTVAFWGIILPWNVAELAIANSQITHAELSIQNGVHVLDGFRPTFYKHFQFGGVTLSSTSIGFWQIALSDISNVEVRNSDLGLLLKGNIGTISVLDSTLTRWWNLSAQGSIAFEGVSVTKEIRILDSIINLYGHLSFTNEAHIVEWHNSTITREFPLVVQDSSGSPLAGAYLALFSPDHYLIGIIKTDSAGQADLTIKFNDKNYDKTWTLNSQRLNIACPIRLLSDTPIVITIDKGGCDQNSQR